MRSRGALLGLVLTAAAVLWAAAPVPAGQADDDCLACHGGSGLKTDLGRSLYVDGSGFGASIHGEAGMAGVGCQNGVGVRIYYAHEFSLHECLISHCHGHAVHLYKNGEVVIRDNWFFGQYYADNWNQTAEIYQNDGNQSVLVRDNHFHSNIRLHLFLDGDQGQYREISRNVSFACSSEGVILQPQYSETTNSSDGYSIVKHNYALCYGPDINTDTAGRCIFEGNLAWAGRWTNLYCNSYNPTPDDIGLRLVVANNIFMAGGWYKNEAYASTTLSAAVNIQAGREVLLTGNLILDAKCHPRGFCAGGEPSNRHQADQDMGCP